LAVLAASAFAAADQLTSRELKTIGEGRGLYVANCAACHQSNLRGTTTPTNVPDLTLIAVRDGRFNRSHVMNHIRFGTQHPNNALGSGQMPYAVGAYTSSSGRTAVDIMKLTRYIEFAQVAPSVKD
jgi:mono/diheme cytochrome c family protein